MGTCKTLAVTHIAINRLYHGYSQSQLIRGRHCGRQHEYRGVLWFGQGPV